MEMMRRRPALSTLALLAFGSALGSTKLARAAASSIVRIAASPIDQTASAYYAQDKGFFKAVGLDIQIDNMTNGAAIIEAITGGAYNIGNSNPGTVAVARERGIMLRFIAPAGLHISGDRVDLLMVRADSSIQTASDLEGKTIAVNGLGTLTQFGVQAWMTANGGILRGVKFVEIPFPAMAPGLQQGRIDAAQMTEPYITAAQGTIRPLADTFDSIANRFMVTGWVATDAWIQEHLDETRRVAAALRKANEWANVHHGESADILIHRAKLPSEVGKTMARVTYGTTLDPALIQPVLDVAAKFGGLPKPMSAASMIM
jgi:NitT/TauT family transport system substrate-binding protein